MPGEPGICVQDGFQCLPVNWARQTPRNPQGDADLGEWRGQGAVPIGAPGKVGLEGHQTPLDGRGFGLQFIAQIAAVGEEVVFRQRVREVMYFGEAPDSPQVLGVGAERVMADTAFMTAGIAARFLQRSAWAKPHRNGGLHGQ